MQRFKVILVLLAVVAGVCCVALNRSSAIDQPQAAQKSTQQKGTIKSDRKDKPKADDSDDEPILNEFMHQKLDASSEILEGLMTENFEMIEKNAGKLLEMSHAESWRASNDMMYLQHSTQFRTTVKELIDEAKSNSIDGASLEWVQVTMSCMQCHKWVRNIMLADSLDRPARAPRIPRALVLR